MANYTTARAGGLADAVLIAQSVAELQSIVRRLWELETPFMIFGSGSNVLVSDTGIRCLVVINRAHTVKINSQHNPPSVWAESGANLGSLARQVALRGLGGLEWAANIPGSLGGAVYGNAGANSADIHSNLIMAEILHRTEGQQSWPVDQMEYQYRSSIFKRNPGQAVILAVRLQLFCSSKEEVQARMETYNAQRRRTQPPGASLGSIFRNPPGDYAGRLIEAAGLKGVRIGGAEISPVHANFFVNKNQAKADDFLKLILLAQENVQQKFAIKLELEIELVGDWPHVELRG